ncbi:MAG TPA: phytanoyl-CoA dioxygenase family protein [Solirubrobacterales bacterium]|nr:phytanoyl-CoA dioxygenase family protein [Solirubrobacterales bacterium]
MNNYWAFAEMTASNDLLGDREALRARLDDEGYLYFRGLIPRERVLALRGEILEVLGDHGWIAGGDKLDNAEVVGMPVREGDEEYFSAYDDVQRLESFHSLAHDDGLVGAVRGALGETAFPHPLKVARLVFPSEPEVSTPPHQDFLNNQGSPDLTAAWIPLGDCPMKQGTLAILRGSQRYGVLPLEFSLGPGNRQAVVPNEMRDRLTWVTNDFSAGDVLLFPAMTVHASLHNATGRMRVSVDFRYQREGEPATDLVLNPHFGRLSWEEIYAGWKSDELKYYWRDLDFPVVPYDRTPFQSSEPDVDKIQEVIIYEHWRKLRHEGKAPGRGRPD